MRNISKLTDPNDTEQDGKFITIYPKGEDHTNKIIKMLDEALTEEYGTRNNRKKTKIPFIEIQGELGIGESGGIFVRYGVTENPLGLSHEEKIFPVDGNYIPLASHRSALSLREFEALSSAKDSDKIIYVGYGKESSLYIYWFKGQEDRSKSVASIEDKRGCAIPSFMKTWQESPFPNLALYINEVPVSWSDLLEKQSEKGSKCSQILGSSLDLGDE